MAATIQTIQKPTRARGLDTSGNNNHAQIYSGRALEFDGVVDYLDAGINVPISTNKWTLAVWIHINTTPASNADNIISAGGTYSSNYLGIDTGRKLTIFDYGNTTWRDANTSLDLNTWYRAVYSYDGAGSLTFYVNGVADGTVTLATAGDDDDLYIRYVGMLSNSSRFFDGMMSDLQAWDLAWTAADAEYDYLNPEQLALNRGGTSLTNSNLKLWYPMNEGHRGNQSYVLDASNTGGTKNNAATVFYGDEQISATNNRTFAGASDWANAAGANAFASYDEETSGQLTVTPDDVGDVQYAFLDGAHWEDDDGDGPDMVAGRTYRLSYDIHVSAFTKGTLSVGLSTDAVPAVMKASNDYTATNGSGQLQQTLDFVYVAANHEMITVYAAANTVLTVDFDNISLKEVGTATGWTDADQQLDIPQTALQSYNQLALFDEGGSSIKILDTDDLSFTNDSTDSAFSISTWFMYSGNQGAEPYRDFYLVCKGGYDGSNHHREYHTYVSKAGTIIFLLYDGATADSGNNHGVYAGKTLASKVNFGQLHHVVFTYNGSDTPNTDAEIYLDGELQSSTASTAGSYAFMKNIDGTDGDMYLGKGGQSGSYGGTGIMNETSIWDKELNLSEVQEIYNDGKALDATTHTASSNLVGYWRNNGLSTWTDLSTNNNNGIIVTVTETMLITAGADGSRDSQGFLMNRQKTTNSLNLVTGDIADGIGSGERAVVPGRIALGTDDFSICFWVKKSESWSNQYIMSQYKDDSNRWYLFSNGTYFRIYMLISGDAPIADYDTTNISAQLDTWIHVAFTVDRDTETKWYINGALSSTGTVNGSGDEASNQEGVSLTVDGDLNIGWYAKADSDDHHFNGQIDDVLIYSNYLSAPEVTRIYNAGKRSHR